MDGGWRGGGRGRGNWRGGGRGWRGGGRGGGGRWGRGGGGGATPDAPSTAGAPLSVAFEAEAEFMACLGDRGASSRFSFCAAAQLDTHRLSLAADARRRDAACPLEMQAAEGGADGATRATLFTVRTPL